MTTLPYRCPDYDGVSGNLTHREWVRRFNAMPSPERFAMVEDETERQTLFRFWLLEVEKKGSQMKLAQVDYETRYR